MRFEFRFDIGPRSAAVVRELVAIGEKIVSRLERLQELNRKLDQAVARVEEDVAHTREDVDRLREQVATLEGQVASGGQMTEEENTLFDQLRAKIDALDPDPGFGTPPDQTGGQQPTPDPTPDPNPVPSPDVPTEPTNPTDPSTPAEPIDPSLPPVTGGAPDDDDFDDDDDHDDVDDQVEKDPAPIETVKTPSGPAPVDQSTGQTVNPTIPNAPLPPAQIGGTPLYQPVTGGPSSAQIQNQPQSQKPAFQDPDQNPDV